MMQNYEILSQRDAENALKEIVQEIALLGLHRSHFFEKAAFYGGTALRILYGLSRFSEDLDFTLLQPDKNFSLTPYFSAIQKELESYGFEVDIKRVDKKIESEIESAFIKAGTKIHFLKITLLKPFAESIQSTDKLQIKFEVDTNPSPGFSVETRYLLKPTSFPIISLKKPDLFAGEIHALLFRKWKNRVKGRDFYDYVWYLKNNTPVNLQYFQNIQSQQNQKTIKKVKNLKDLQSLLKSHFETIDFKKVKQDVLPFIKDPRELEVWSPDFFIQITDKLTVTSAG